MNSLIQLQVQGQQQFEEKLRLLYEALDTRTILDQGAALLFNRMRTRFLSEIDPTGVKWPRSQAAIRREKSGRGGGTLFDTGKLFRSLQLSAFGESRVISTNVTDKRGFPYGTTHQFGLFGNPRRQFIGFGDDDVHLMSSFIFKRIRDAIT
jgi:phage gpG-like protein